MANADCCGCLVVNQKRSGLSGLLGNECSAVIKTVPTRRHQTGTTPDGDERRRVQPDVPALRSAECDYRLRLRHGVHLSTVRRRQQSGTPISSIGLGIRQISEAEERKKAEELTNDNDWIT